MKRILLIIFAVLTFCALYFMAFNHQWTYHLESDVFAFNERAGDFLKNLSFSGIKVHDYLPGALFFFLIPIWFTGLEFHGYLQGFIVLNFLLLIIFLIIYGKWSGFLGQISLLLILMAVGPILLFRFDLLVTLLVAASVIVWKRNKYSLSSFLLGLAVIVKGYPVVIFPYYLIILSKSNLKLEIMKSVASFCFGGGIVVGAYLLMGGNFSEIIEGLRFNYLKPVGIESIPFGVSTVISLLTTGLLPEISVGYGVWGAFYNNNFLGFLWVAPVLCFYIYFYFESRIRSFSVGVIFLLLTWFLLFLKNINPQYIFWSISIFPLLRPNTKARKKYFLLLGTVLLIAILTQLIYPINFSSYISYFQTGKGAELFALQVLRNILLLILFLFGVKYIIVEKSIK